MKKTPLLGLSISQLAVPMVVVFVIAKG